MTWEHCRTFVTTFADVTSVFFWLRNRSPAAPSLILVPHLSGQLNTVTLIRLLYYASWNILVSWKCTDGIAV